MTAGARRALKWIFLAPMAPALFADVLVLWITIPENLGGDFTDVVTGGFSYETAVTYFLIYFVTFYVPVAAFIAICLLPFAFGNEPAPAAADLAASTTEQLPQKQTGRRVRFLKIAAIVIAVLGLVVFLRHAYRLDKWQKLNAQYEACMSRPDDTRRAAEARLAYARAAQRAGEQRAAFLAANQGIEALQSSLGRAQQILLFNAPPGSPERATLPVSGATVSAREADDEIFWLKQTLSNYGDLRCDPAPPGWRNALRH